MSSLLLVRVLLAVNLVCAVLVVPAVVLLALTVCADSPGWLKAVMVVGSVLSAAVLGAAVYTARAALKHYRRPAG